MRILILGASGGVGKQIVARAVAHGHQVTAVTRASAPIEATPQIKVFHADVTQESSLDEIMSGHDAVLSALGIKRENAKNPWSPLASPPNFSSLSAQHIVASMKKHGVKTVLAVSAAGVAESAASMNLLMKFFVAKSNVGLAYRDLALMESVYKNSGLNWCCPRPTRLTDGALTTNVQIVGAFSMMAAISRADVAQWMIESLESGRFEPRTPIISSN
jgi:putative NADH-flavin reductase